MHDVPKGQHVLDAQYAQYVRTGCTLRSVCTACTAYAIRVICGCMYCMYCTDCMYSIYNPTILSFMMCRTESNNYMAWSGTNYWVGWVVCVLMSRVPIRMWDEDLGPNEGLQYLHTVWWESQESSQGQYSTKVDKPSVGQLLLLLQSWADQVEPLRQTGSTTWHR